MNTTIQKQCPFCRHPYAEVQGACATCKVAYPWVESIAEIKTQLKERETNRARATLTVIDELLGAARGGKPVSASALKGLVFAWLYPRTVIVIGSLVSLLLLIMQTAIIYKQTDLLAGQTEAAQFEQAEKLRQRSQELVDLSQRLSDTQLFFAGLAKPDFRCQGPCRNSRLEDLLPALKGRQFRFDGSDEALAQAGVFSGVMPAGSHELYALWAKMRLTLPRLLGSEAMAWFPLHQMADQAALRCDVGPALVISFTDNTKQLTSWFWLQHRLDQDIEESLRNVLFTSFPRALQANVSDALRDSPGTATLDDLNRTMKGISDSAVSSLDAMIQGCRKRIDRHIERLRVIER